MRRIRYFGDVEWRRGRKEVEEASPRFYRRFTWPGISNSRLRGGNQIALGRLFYDLWGFRSLDIRDTVALTAEDVSFHSQPPATYL